MSRRAKPTLLTGAAAVAAATLVLNPAPAGAATPATPAIKAVHFSYLGPNMRIEVDGTGFGTPAIGLPYAGTVPNFSFSDTSRNETWGGNGNWPLEYTSWTSTKVVIDGLDGNGGVMAADQVSVSDPTGSAGTRLRGAVLLPPRRRRPSPPVNQTRSSPAWVSVTSGQTSRSRSRGPGSAPQRSAGPTPTAMCLISISPIRRGTRPGGTVTGLPITFLGRRRRSR